MSGLLSFQTEQKHLFSMLLTPIWDLGEVKGDYLIWVLSVALLLTVMTANPPSLLAQLGNAPEWQCTHPLPMPEGAGKDPPPLPQGTVIGRSP